MKHNRLDTGAIALMALLCALWGLNQVAIKVADGGIAPVLQAGLRSAGAAVLLWLWAAARGIPLFRRDGTLALGALIAAMFAAEFIFVFGGIVYTNASRAVLFLYTAPFVVAIGAHLFVPGERLRPIHVAGLVSAFAGIALAFADALRLPTHRELLGDAMVLLGAVFWGTTTVVIKATRLARISAHRALFYQLAGSAVILLVLSPLLGERGVFAPSVPVWAALGFQTVVVAFVTYLAWFGLIARYPVFKLSAFSFLTPLFGLIAGGALLGEPLSALLVAAVALVGVGIWLVNRTPSAVPVPAETDG
ncbi:MAG: DMT family transporter [Alphaproteobacteria bacterium]|nr:DMT family transporter [Alphaproteobacteria bacterium]